MHIFHCMQRGSPFGSLFSEINQQTALELLSNIKPELLATGNDRRRMLIGCHKSHSSTETEDEGPSRSSSMDVEWESYAAAGGEAGKAYKPKFHFRRQKVIPKQSSASSEPDLASVMGTRYLSLDDGRSKSLQNEEKAVVDVDSDLELDFDLEEDDDAKCPRSFMLNSRWVNIRPVRIPGSDWYDQLGSHQYENIV